MFTRLAYENPTYSAWSAWHIAFATESLLYRPWFDELNPSNPWRRAYLDYVSSLCNKRPERCGEAKNSAP